MVETRRHSLVYDAGPSFRTGSDTGQLVVVPYLRARGIRTLDRLVVSHDDDDHKGGARSVLELLPALSLVTGPSLSADAVGGVAATLARETCRRGEAWAWDGVGFEWLHPGFDRYERDNDSSCVLLLRAGEHTVLVTGDIEAVAEQGPHRGWLHPAGRRRDRAAPWQPNVIHCWFRRSNRPAVGRVRRGASQPLEFSGTARRRALGAERCPGTAHESQRGYHV